MAYLSSTILAQQWLGYAGTTDNATLVAMAIGMAEDEIDRYINQPVLQVSKDVRFIGRGTREIALPFSLDVTLSTVTYRATAQDSYTPMSGLPAVYRDGGLFILDSDGVFVKGYQYKVTVLAGFTPTTAIPADIYRSGYELAKEIVLETVKGAIGPDRFAVSAISEAEGGQTLSRALIAQAGVMKQRLAKYRVLDI